MDHHHDIDEYLTNGLLIPETLDIIYSQCQTKFSSLELYNVFANKSFNEEVAHWIIRKNLTWSIISNRHSQICPMYRVMLNPNLSASVFEIIIRAIVVYTGDLEFVSYKYCGYQLLYLICSHKIIGPEMFQVLLEINKELPFIAHPIDFTPQPDDKYPVYISILAMETQEAYPEWGRLYHILQLLKSFKIVLPIITNKTIDEIRIHEMVNSIAANSTREMNLIELLVELSGEVFELIDLKYLADLEIAQAIANAYYNSDWFTHCVNPDQALELIPPALRLGLRKNGTGSRTKPAPRLDLT
jgi:hypothetical protein